MPDDNTPERPIVPDIVFDYRTYTFRRSTPEEHENGLDHAFVIPEDRAVALFLLPPHHRPLSASISGTVDADFVIEPEPMNPPAPTPTPAPTATPQNQEEIAMPTEDQTPEDESPENEAVTCSSCGDDVHESEVYRITAGTREGREYCSDCYDDYACECEGCNEFFHNSEITSYRTSNVSSVTVDLCDECHEESYTPCESCGVVLHNDSEFLVSDDDISGYYCRTCHERIVAEIEAENDRDEDDEDGPRNAGSNRYGYPAYTLHAPFTAYRRGIDKSETPTAYGIEIEMETTGEGRYKLADVQEYMDSANKAIREHLNRTDLKPDRSFVGVGSDGSLTSEYGAEFGFLPLRIETLRHLFRDYRFRRAYKTLADDYRMSPARCRRIGLHISVSERIFTPRARHRLAQIFAALDRNYNSSGSDYSGSWTSLKDVHPTRRLAVRLLGRRPSDYSNNRGSCAMSKAKQDYEEKTHAVAVRNIAQFRDTYNPKRRTLSEGRIELRAFASSHDPAKIIERVELANDMVTYALMDGPLMSDTKLLYSFLRFHAKRRRRRARLEAAWRPEPAKRRPRLTAKQRESIADRKRVAESMDSAAL